jgi:hypothetical protein
MQTSHETKKPTHLLKKVHQKNTPMPHNHMKSLTQHRTTVKETIGRQWEQFLAKALLDSLKNISQNMIKYESKIMILKLYSSIDKWMANEKIDNEL